MKTLSEFCFGDMLLRYTLDDRDRVSMQLIPVGMKERETAKEYRPEPLVQLHARGDKLADGYGNGHTLAGTAATDALRLCSQKREGNTVITTVSDGRGRTVHHRAAWAEGLEALVVSCAFENTGERPVTLNLLSSVHLSGLTPFTEGDAAGALPGGCGRKALRKPCWSAPGRGMPCGCASSARWDPCRYGDGFPSRPWRTGRPG